MTHIFYTKQSVWVKEYSSLLCLQAKINWYETFNYTRTCYCLLSPCVWEAKCYEHLFYFLHLFPYKNTCLKNRQSPNTWTTPMWPCVLFLREDLGVVYCRVKNNCFSSILGLMGNFVNRLGVFSKLIGPWISRCA